MFGLAVRELKRLIDAARQGGNSRVLMRRVGNLGFCCLSIIPRLKKNGRSFAFEQSDPCERQVHFYGNTGPVIWYVWC